MQSGYTKQVNAFFSFDDQGNVIPESRVVRTTWFDQDGNKSKLPGKSSTQSAHYENMTTAQKAAFDSMVDSYKTLKAETV